ncbi:MAG TPA: hypothetical protein VFJ85_14925 [Acidimicrobiales bacterium]|nr:hypothetical protein [Acidimicrobiales bacterium]
MAGRAKGSGPRSGLYSEQRFTNWSRHDPYWSEVEALPARTRPRAAVAEDEDRALCVYERPLATGFTRPWRVDDVVDVLRRVPQPFVAGLAGVYLMGGTAAQGRRRALTFGMYADDRIFLFPVAHQRIAEGWRTPTNPAKLSKYTKFGAAVRPASRGATTVVFDEASLRRFYLYDVLLHEIGHHADRSGASRNAERYAQWFAEFQYAHLPTAG